MGRGTDEFDVVLLAGLGKGGVLRQDAVAGVDGVHAPALGKVDDAGDVQIGTQRRLVLADQVGFVGLDAEQAVDVLVGVHRHGVQTQVVAGPENADGDLAAVGGQNFVELFRHLIPSIGSDFDIHSVYVHSFFLILYTFKFIITARRHFCKRKNGSQTKIGVTAMIDSFWPTGFAKKTKVFHGRTIVSGGKRPGQPPVKPSGVHSSGRARTVRPV